MSDNEVNMAMSLDGIAMVIGVIIVAVLIKKTIKSWREGNSIKNQMIDELNKLKLVREE